MIDIPCMHYAINVLTYYKESMISILTLPKVIYAISKTFFVCIYFFFNIFVTNNTTVVSLYKQVALISSMDPGILFSFSK